MAHVTNRSTDFVSEAVRGFCDAYSRYVVAVPGGVVRSTVTPTGKVAVLNGGGSGHYPAFVGYVGPGFADVTATGDVFASPSARQVEGVARLAERGAGVLMTFGNYAGDVLNFTLAAERLRRDGIPVEIVAVTDDIASATANEQERRRGIAGGVVVTKVVGAAAEAGHDLDHVADVARRINAATRSLGVAFAGCTLPGADEALFSVPHGRMATGLGIHGEPGIDEVDLPTADELADRLVDAVLGERPDGAGDRVAVVLNGLGASKYEELFVLWNAVAGRLRGHGLDLVAPLVGEYVTSLDMAGVSLTVAWLDEETATLWQAAGQCPALSTGPLIDTEPAPAPDVSVLDHDESTVPDADAASRGSARRISTLMDAVAAALSEHEGELGRLDAVAGDGDHGLGMARGSAAAADAARRAVEAGAGAATTLTRAADAWADKAGGTSGALWGVGLARWAGALSDTGGPDGSSCARGARAALDGVLELGGATPGDKTLVDALGPFVEEFERAVGDADVAAAWQRAAVASTHAADATADLTPRIGRARPLAERSKGHPDAGAVSLALCARTVADTIDSTKETD